MKRKSLDACLREFISKVDALDRLSFIETANWRLCDDVMNGVEIGYEIESATDRTILHELGQEHGLIPLCPRDVVDMDRSSGSLILVVRTSFGPLPIRPKSV